MEEKPTTTTDDDDLSGSDSIGRPRGSKTDRNYTYQKDASVTWGEVQNAVNSSESDR